MKGLLHSKTFRDNLKKWLFMYVGTILVFTSVVTYSKFVSIFNNSDNARPAKFNIVVEYLDKCNPEITGGEEKPDDETGSSNETEEPSGESSDEGNDSNENEEGNSDVVCPITPNSRPLENYDFYFKVDTTEIEVKSLIKITTSIDSAFTKSATNKENIFEIKEIAVVDKDLKTVKKIVCSATSEDEKTVCNTSYTDSYAVLPDNEEQEPVRYYRVSVLHNIQDADYNVETNRNESVVVVGYSALQEN